MSGDGGPALPTFFVIGAPKCGTTSLHSHLDQHPEIAMSAVKEPRVFADAAGGADLGRYRGLLDPYAPRRGESSTVYSQFPHYPGVPERIRGAVPEARFVYLVRDPIDRAVAHYSQHVVDGKESRPLAEALSDLEEQGSTYVCASRYATQLRRYLDCFDRSRVLVLDLAELREWPEGALERVFGFLGVDPAFRSPQFTERLNTRRHHRTPTALGRRVRGTGAFAALRRAPLPASVRRPLRQLVSREVERPPLDPALRERLRASLRDEVEWLRDFTGLGFEDWSL